MDLHPEATAGIAAVFAAYAEGFDDFSTEAVANCFIYPVTIWQQGSGNVFETAEDLIENIEALFAVFEGEEIVASRFEMLECHVSAGSAFAVVSWRQERADGETALAFTGRYTLLRDESDDEWPDVDEDAWRIAFVVTGDTP